jgi:hypothetical protein
VGGSASTNLHFNAGSKDTAEAIVTKLESSKKLSGSSPPATPHSANGTSSAPSPAQARRLPPIDGKLSKKKASVHFSPSSPVVIPRREPSEEGEAEPEVGEHAEEDDYHVSADGKGALVIALYDFDADDADELSVKEGEQLTVLEKEADDWWKCRNTRGAEGVVPASYLEVSSSRTAFSVLIFSCVVFSLPMLICINQPPQRRSMLIRMTQMSKEQKRRRRREDLRRLSVNALKKSIRSWRLKVARDESQLPQRPRTSDVENTRLRTASLHPRSKKASLNRPRTFFARLCTGQLVISLTISSRTHVPKPSNASPPTANRGSSEAKREHSLATLLKAQTNVYQRTPTTGVNSSLA